jgi:hypothetical protein
MAGDVEALDHEALRHGADSVFNAGHAATAGAAQEDAGVWLLLGGAALMARGAVLLSDDRDQVLALVENALAQTRAVLGEVMAEASNAPHH